MARAKAEKADLPNPALVPEPVAVEVAEREYKVVGPLRVHDTDPGHTFKATLSPEQEAFLVDVGHITRNDQKGK